jgi:hypothetical protein
MTAIDFGENMGFRSSTVPMSISLAVGKESYARLSLSTEHCIVSRTIDSAHPVVHSFLVLVGTPDLSCLFKMLGNGKYM